MAKDQFRDKQKVVSLTSRFEVLPLLEKDDEFLCVDANFNFLAVKKARLEQYNGMALPETYDSKLTAAAKLAAKSYLPQEQKKIDKLVFHLKNKGVAGFLDELNKHLAS